MKAKAPVRFDIDALRKLAGAEVFARGQEYHRDGSVQILSLNSKRVLAQVSGSEDYRAVLTGRGSDIDGECSCRAFADWGFCKHMVATALAANVAGDGAEAEAAGALSRIRDHLKRKGIDAEALEVYAAQVEQLANGARYDEAAKVIARMEKIRSQAEQASYVADIKVRHGRKRNFMKLLG